MKRRPTSIKLINAFGIRVGVDGSWFVILFLLIYMLAGPFRSALHSSDGVAYATTVVSVLLLFASLIVHELGHALVARRQGIEVRRIDLFLFGGLTRMSRDPRSPGEEFKVAAAGPAATLVVILVCLGVDLAILGPHRLSHAVTLDSHDRITPVLLSLSWLLPMNVLLLVFNLVPAFPLDGGRIARAVVWRVTDDRNRGTRASARLGQGFAVLLAGLGFWLVLALGNLTGLWLVAVAWLIRQAASGVLVQSTLTERIEGVRVADVMDRQPVAIPAEMAVSQALEDFYLRYGWSWFPVTDAGGRFVGIARQAPLQAARERGEGWLTVGALAEEREAGQWRVDEDRPLTEVLSSESLGRLGAVMAVDADGVLRGVVTADQVRRALQSPVGSPAA